MISSLSQSMLGMWSRCQQQFYYRYLEGLIVPPGIAARIGTGVHKGAEHSNRVKVDGKRPRKKDVVESAVEGYEKSCLEGGVYFAPSEKNTAKKQIAAGIDTVADLAKLFHDEVAPKIKPVAVEETLTLEEPGLDVPFIGTIDWRDQDPGWWGDIKTAARAWSQEKADASIQATLYPALIKANFGHQPDRLTFELLVKTKTPRHVTVETSRTPEDWAALVRRAKLLLQSIQAGLFHPADPESWVCNPKWCGWFYRCPHVSPRRKAIPKKETDNGI